MFSPKGYPESSRYEVMINLARSPESKLPASDPKSTKWLWRQNGRPPAAKKTGPFAFGKYVVGANCKECGSRLYPHTCW